MKKNRIKTLAVACAAALLCAGTLIGCGQETAPETSAPQSSAVEIASSQPEATKPFEIGDQLKKPEKGEEIAVIHTTQGTIKMRLFPEQAPKSVANFKKLAENGVYDNCEFHRIIDNFMIQTGRVNGTSIYGDMFEDEFSEQLLNLRGAVSMANISQPNTNGTQFFINQTPPENGTDWDKLLEVYRVYQQHPEEFLQMYPSWPDMSKVTTEVRELYEQHGGNPTLDGAYSVSNIGHTVFGQVFEGMKVVDKIAKAKTDQTDAPVSDDYRILNITFEKYEG